MVEKDITHRLAMLQNILTVIILNNFKNRKILCVICSKPNITKNNKCFNLFSTGFENKTLCYVQELEEII